MVYELEQQFKTRFDSMSVDDFLPAYDTINRDTVHQAFRF
jgi:hypothetical protein